MHNIDRTLTDVGDELEYFDELEYDDMDEFEAEYEAADDDEFELEYEEDYEDEWDELEAGVFDEDEEYELAAELLSTSTDEELEMFLGRLIKRAAKKVRRAVKSPVGRALRRGLRRVAKRVLPHIGRAAGTFVGGPVGGRIGSRLARAGGKVFGLELEGLSGEDREFEVARRVVRLAGKAAQNAASQSSTGSAVTDAKKAVAKAAAVHAPGLVGRTPMAGAVHRAAGSVRGGSGRWVRRGGKIVLIGA
ncbi:hypothetical protein SAMN04488011_11018 [Palleronia pelagia]|uniref:Uncharacterized protein n=2 Tax=Palleronia pelagia TaxID=387096 RepID=A0A1H8LD01_9RHOB|nr:hypothetical protein SAMN04488011_11018 [Palleronia pelagia]